MLNIPIEISARHVHLSAEAWPQLFGAEAISVKTLISQPPQFLATQRVTLEGPKGSLERVAIVGPVRSYSQVELAVTDAKKLGIKPPLSESGSLQGAANITIIGPHGRLTLPVAITQRRHIHASPADLTTYGVSAGQEVIVRILGPRGGLFEHILVRVHPDFSWQLHLDTDEANALGVTPKTEGEVLLML